MPDALAPAIRDIKSPYRGFSLTEVAQLATQLGMPNQMAKWSDSAEIPVPSVVNWKLGHYAAIIGKEGEKYRVKDLTFGFDNLISDEAIRAEASGYFLVAGCEPAAGLRDGVGFRRLEGLWQGQSGLSRCPTKLPRRTIKLPEKPDCQEWPITPLHTMMVSLHVEDTPVGYDPPFGPQVRLSVSYNERETLQPANLNSPTFGRQWTHNWSGCIRINTAAAATVVLRAGGSEDHPINPSDPSFGSIHPKSHSRLVKVSPTRWDRLLPDGAKEVYEALTEPDVQGFGIFWLSQVIDPAGNAVTLQYDSDYRLSTITDALGQKTTFQLFGSWRHLQGLTSCRSLWTSSHL